MQPPRWGMSDRMRGRFEPRRRAPGGPELQRDLLARCNRDTQDVRAPSEPSLLPGDAAGPREPFYRVRVDPEITGVRPLTTAVVDVELGCAMAVAAIMLQGNADVNPLHPW